MPAEMPPKESSKEVVGGASWTPPTPQMNEPRVPPPSPAYDPRYFALTIRIRIAWLIAGVALLLIGYPVMVIYTAFSMQYNESHPPSAIYRTEWDATGCPEQLREQAKFNQSKDWRTQRRWMYLLRLNDTFLIDGNQTILDNPYCFGAEIRMFSHKPGPWRYDVVDSNSQRVVLTITKNAE